jgi:hypothetical protein
MPINNIPFIALGSGVYRPYLPTRIRNPKNNMTYNTWSIIDTGADECSFPGAICKFIGIDIKKLKAEDATAVGGKVRSFKHPVIISTIHPVKKYPLFSTDVIDVCFSDTLPIALLGANNFLKHFILTVDYPKLMFSMNYPTIVKK